MSFCKGGVPIFLSTPSARRATLLGGTAHDHDVQFLSTPSARRATLQKPSDLGFSDISIHALREEGDEQWVNSGAASRAISIHALREEGDTKSGNSFLSLSVFLSTPSARRATIEAVSITSARKFLSTPSARRATCMIHPKRMSCWLFLSTPSARRATTLSQSLSSLGIISIHALREEGDLKSSHTIRFGT